jgi:hypothetical protein
MIGSHNSFTYSKPDKWWGKLLAPWAKCQNLTIQEQYRIGVRYFDLRVAFDKSYNLRLVHNCVNFPSKDLYNNLEWLNQQSNIYLRIILDMRKEPKDEAIKQQLLVYFQNFCNFMKGYDNITIDKIIIGWNWEYTYDSGIRVIEWHSSVCTKWYEYIRGTQCWAELHNSWLYSNMPEIIANDKEVVLLDYVEYG